jgi:hypothetical protein
MKEPDIAPQFQSDRLLRLSSKSRGIKRIRRPAAYATDRLNHNNIDGHGGGSESVMLHLLNVASLSFAVLGGRLRTGSRRPRDEDRSDRGKKPQGWCSSRDIHNSRTEIHP